MDKSCPSGTLTDPILYLEPLVGLENTFASMYQGAWPPRNAFQPCPVWKGCKDQGEVENSAHEVGREKRFYHICQERPGFYLPWLDQKDGQRRQDVRRPVNP